MERESKITSVQLEQIIREYLPQIVHMSLGTCKDNRPWVCEVHFAYDEQLNLYFRSLTSRRHSREIAENPNVAGNIVRQHQLDEVPLGVYFEGTAQRLEPGAEQQKAAACIEQRLQKPASEALAEAAREDGHQFYKISVDIWRVFGNLENTGGQKYNLVWKVKQQ